MDRKLLNRRDRKVGSVCSSELTERMEFHGDKDRIIRNLLKAVIGWAVVYNGRIEQILKEIYERRLD